MRHYRMMHWATKYVTIPSFSLLAVVGVIVALVDAPADEQDASAPEEEREPDPTAGMRYACGEFIRQSLNDPSSFEAVRRTDWSTHERDDGIVTVAATYRASNQFGAIVTETTYCDIVREDGQLRLKAFR